MGAGHHVRDRFGLHFHDPAAVAAALVLVKKHVSGFVSEGLDGLGVVNVVADRDEPLAEVRVAVWPAEVRAPTYVESPCLEEALQAIPQSDGGLPREEGRLIDLGVGQRRPIGLPDVEHRDGFRADEVCPVQDAALVVTHQFGQASSRRGSRRVIGASTLMPVSPRRTWRPMALNA